MKKQTFWLSVVLTCFFAANLFSQTRAVILPERFKSAPVLVVNDEKYKRLVSENALLADQLELERLEREEFTAKVDEQKRRNHEIQNQLLNDYNQRGEQLLRLEKKVAEKTSAILRRNIVIGLAMLIISAYLFAKFYLRLPI